MKTLTLRIKDQKLLDELDSLKTMLNIKTDSGVLMQLLKVYRQNDSFHKELTLEYSALQNELSEQERIRDNFKNAFDELFNC